MKATLLLSVLSAAVLVACGGGGGGSGSSTPSASPEGFWADTKNTSTYVFGVLVEADGSIWGLAVDSNAIGISTGKVAVTGNSFSGSNIELVVSASNRAFFASTISGTFVERQTLNAIADYGNGVKANAAFNFSPTYDTPFTVTPKNYTGATTERQATTLSVASNGTFTGKIGTCAFDGVLTYTHKNYERVSVKFHGGSCSAGSATLNGVVIGSASSIAVILNDGAGKPIGAFFQ